MIRSRLALVSILLLACASLHAQDEEPFSSLEERMTGREFNETGLYKLDPDELAALNQWLRERSVANYEYEGPSGAARGTGASSPDAGVSIENMAREPFQARIAGEFSGWTGDTVFELDNGMVWRQVDGETFYIPPVENPQVRIRPALMSSWVLSVEGYNTTVRVERIR